MRPADRRHRLRDGTRVYRLLVSGFYGQLFVVDLKTLEVIKSFDQVHPPDQDPLEISHFYIKMVEEVGGVILIVGSGGQPPDYDRLTPQYASYTRISVIDPQTLEFIGYQTGIEPGFSTESVLDVDGKAWLFNSLSHMHERPERVDVHIMDPRSLEITDRFNLDQPFPEQATQSRSGDIYIHHASIQRWRDRWGNVSGITRLDPATGEREFTPVDGPTTVISDLGVYRDRPCAALGTRKATDGLWCLNDQGTLELKIPQPYVDRVVFPPESRGIPN